MIELRPIEMEDVPEIARLLGAGPEISVRTASIPFPYTEDDAHDFLRRIGETGERVFAIVAEDRLVGTIGIIGWGLETEIGYWIGKEYWGHGYGTAAVEALIEFCRTQEMSRLTADVFIDNPASARVLAKNGFVLEGEVERDLPERGGLRKLWRFVRDLR